MCDLTVQESDVHRLQGIVIATTLNLLLSSYENIGAVSSVMRLSGMHLLHSTKVVPREVTLFVLDIFEGEKGFLCCIGGSNDGKKAYCRENR